MIAVAFAFLAGRYHATGWDHHVNEGAVEWPPAPWRILRALVAASYRAGIPEADARPLVQRLASTLPKYRLPRASLGHTRHYMPTDGQPTKVLDAFVAVGAPFGPGGDPVAVVVGWEVELSEAERALLARLVRHVPWLGRAESWVSAELVDPPGSWNAVPAGPTASERATTVLACLSAEAHAQWHAAQPAPTGKGRRRIEVPRDAWEALQVDTSVLGQQAWSGPPGTRWVRYAFDVDPFRAPFAARRPQVALPTTAVFAVRSRAPLHVERTLFFAERFRTALLGRAGEVLRGASPSVLSGHGADGAPRRGHGHASYLPVDSDGDGFVDQLIVHAPDGFEMDVQRVLSALRRLGRSDEAVRVALIALGRDELEGPLVALGPARVWESGTPFFAPRHLKPRADGTLKHPPDAQIRLLCGDLGLPEPTIEPGPPGLAIAGRDRPLPWYRFKQDRFRGGGDRGSRTAYAFRLTFPVEIRGPLALGYGAHFGLGQFRPRFAS